MTCPCAVPFSGHLEGIFVFTFPGRLVRPVRHIKSGRYEGVPVVGAALGYLLFLYVPMPAGGGDTDDSKHQGDGGSFFVVSTPSLDRFKQSSCCVLACAKCQKASLSLLEGRLLLYIEDRVTPASLLFPPSLSLLQDDPPGWEGRTFSLVDTLPPVIVSHGYPRDQRPYHLKHDLCLRMRHDATSREQARSTERCLSR